ncbi:helix-turn-helix domain-containing protein [Rodentibacter haemolyticus]|uniref:Helix-turn-helix domain-containing protein n=1 Tax=Rodentibacter haemolyticus TaxID=2778911 RepID=A0ABX6UUE5_9PAST|nr:helix-turn-helix domain-containing protein [Rodentibacter haemolyticus]QPB41588.1 helix-turn-helix domain-containing protein [Rodentibacter haemolyticus]
MTARKKGQKAQPIERTKMRNAILKQLLQGKITQGQALRKLRVEVLGISQERYCQLVKVSRLTLSEIENDKGNYSVETLNQIFRPMGLEMGVIPIHKPLLSELLTSGEI